MEDGAPAHTSKKSCDNRNNLGIDVFFERGIKLSRVLLFSFGLEIAPDLNLNPIEHAWEKLNKD